MSCQCPLQVAQQPFLAPPASRVPVTHGDCSGGQLQAPLLHGQQGSCHIPHQCDVVEHDAQATHHEVLLQTAPCSNGAVRHIRRTNQADYQYCYQHPLPVVAASCARDALGTWRASAGCKARLASTACSSRVTWCTSHADARDTSHLACAIARTDTHCTGIGIDHISDV